MPCYTDPPTDTEIALRDLNEFLDEIGDTTKRKLCDWCKRNPKGVKAKSLEFQIWWRDHQAADARHEAAARKRKRVAALRADALKKLTPEERKALSGHGRED